MKHLSLLAAVVVMAGTPLVATAQTAPTMNQPNNGFHEGPDPEWAVLHSTDMRGTAEHRQYHREAVRAHLLWHSQHRTENGTAAYIDAHRIFHQDRNMAHRLYHTPIVTP